MAQTEDHVEQLNLPGFRVPWSALAIGLATIAIASLGTLIVVASVQNVDALSTVALALAVLAFAAQLIVSLAQSSAGAQQIAQAERINAATQAALADLRATSHSQLANQKELFAQVLHAALPEVAQEISDDAAASGNQGNRELAAADIEARLENAINRALVNYDSSRLAFPHGLVLSSRSELERILSPAQMRVGLLIAEGKSVNEVSQTLGISRSTAANLSHTIMRKLGGKSIGDIRAIFAAISNDKDNRPDAVE